MPTSRNNPRLKLVRQLRQRKLREQSSLFVVEGIRHVGEAVEAGAQVEFMVYAPSRLTSGFGLKLIADQTRRGGLCLDVEADLFDSLADKDNPQGLLAVVRQKTLALQDVNLDQDFWGVALVSPQDPGNIGAVLRTMEAVGAQVLFLLDDSADPYHPSAVRASMGALFWIPIVQTAFDDFAGWVKQRSCRVYGTSSHASREFRSLPAYQRPCILLLGSERTGLTADQAAICAEMLRLPMQGRATSLNLAVAAGVMLYDMQAKILPAGAPNVHP